MSEGRGVYGTTRSPSVGGVVIPRFQKPPCLSPKGGEGRGPH